MLSSVMLDLYFHESNYQTEYEQAILLMMLYEHNNMAMSKFLEHSCLINNKNALFLYILNGNY